MDEEYSRDNLSQKWLRYLRAATKGEGRNNDLHSLNTSPAPHPNPLVATTFQTKEESFDRSHFDTSSIKKQAIGFHKPSASVITTYSNDSSRSEPAQDFSAEHSSSPQLQAKEAQNESPIGSFRRRKHPSTITAQQTLTKNTNNASNTSTQHLSGQPDDNQETPPQPLQMVRQPETRAISQEQLVAEVKGIYAGLVMVEAKCIQVDAKQAALAREAPVGTLPQLNNEQWQALIALHRTLLHEHHDFFLASQHPSATPAVRRLAIKYAMPARLWRHSIHSFLELLRNRLPDSLDHMLAFIYLAYSMMTLLYETVPAFEETWIECLGDLGRYRIAVEDNDIRDREVWTQVARQWYLKASDRSPEIGRLYLHLAILARPNLLQQLFFYIKALSVPQVFIAARESILTLFQPIVEGKQARRLPLIITAYIKLHALLFSRKSQESFAATLEELRNYLDSYIGRVTQKYSEQGYQIAISNILALLGYGLPDAILLKALSGSNASENIDVSMSKTGSDVDTSDALVFQGAQQLFVETIKIHLQRIGDPNILSFLHVTMIFIVFTSYSANAMKLLEAIFPWKDLVAMLNTLLRFYHNYSRIEGDLLPVPDKNDFRPTPEEFALRGLFWTVRYFIPGWFHNKNIEDENQYKEDASMNTDYRPERILWLGCQLAKSGKWICYSQERHEFSLDTLMVSDSPSEIGSDNESTAETATMVGDSDPCEE